MKRTMFSLSAGKDCEGTVLFFSLLPGLPVLPLFLPVPPLPCFGWKTFEIYDIVYKYLAPKLIITVHIHARRIFKLRIKKPNIFKMKVKSSQVLNCISFIHVKLI